MLLYTMTPRKFQAVPTLAQCLSVATETRELRVADGALRELPDLLRTHFQADSVFLIADENTFRAAGTDILDILENSAVPILGRHIFPAHPVLRSDYARVGELVRTLQGTSASPRDPQTVVPIAIGGGTINDLVKRSAFELSIPYLCVPTAPSVDGYTASGAALLEGSFKRTFPCPAPRVVVADTAILSRAPDFLRSSGFGDLAGKLVAGSDWIIAEMVAPAGAKGTEPIEAFAWAMTQLGLRAALERSLGTSKEARGSQFEALAITGFAMQYTKSSRPVSGCEHLWSHIWEMGDLSIQGIPVTHGHKVALGTLCATALTETIFSSPQVRSWIAERPVPEITLEQRVEEVGTLFSLMPGKDAALGTAIEKFHDGSTRKRIKELVVDRWTEFRHGVLNQLMPYQELRTLLQRAGCPIRGEDIGLSRVEALETGKKAQVIRNRYTALDLAWDLGILGPTLERIKDDPLYLR
jgi:glycerol-1-phosphate dehydrogenase [NAD(P)+]